MDLNQLQQGLTSNREEAESIKSDLDKAKELLASCDNRLQILFGEQKVENQGQKPLRVWIKNILNNSNEPLTVKEIAELVLEAGYKTSSKQNFRNIVQQTIMNDSEFRRRTKPKLRPARYALEEV
jgi:hypothetical protein